jgi:membrane associated rhomboid family serine protease
MGLISVISWHTSCLGHHLPFWRWRTVLTLLVILVIGGYAIYALTPEERLRIARRAEGASRSGLQVAIERQREPEPFRDALRSRTPWAFVTGAIVFVNVTVFLFMSFGSGASGEPETLLGWGASFAPLTTNGEWWRLATSVFVHAGFFHLLMHIIGLTQAAIVMERIVGHLAFATVYVAAGLFASIETVSTHPMTITNGATGAVFGVYGLLVAALMWSLLQRAADARSILGDLRGTLGLGRSSTEAEAPLISRESESDEPVDPDALPKLPMFTVRALIALAIPMVLFVLYAAAAGLLDTAALSGLVAGFAAGLVLTRKASEAKPPLFQSAAAAVVALVVIVGSAAMLSGVADVRPEIANVIALEDRTAVAYEKAVNQFKNGAMSSQALAKMINQTIVPELRAAQARLKSVKGVPAEHQPLVASADEYFRLRDESWRLRADALNKSNMNALRAADRSERASLEALQRIRPAEAPPSPDAPKPSPDAPK